MRYSALTVTQIKRCHVLQARKPHGPSRSKYRNKPTDGYASKREAARAGELKLLQQIGEIADLKEQVRFVLIPKQDGERECAYVADFQYFDKDGVRHVEDVKGMRTDVYKIKRKLMKWVFGVTVEEV